MGASSNWESPMSVRYTNRWRGLRIATTNVLILLFAWMGPPNGAKAEEAQADNLKQLSLEQLGDLEVTSVSKAPEQLQKTPAAIFVITQEDIRRSGATSIPEALRLAPGVQVGRID